MSAHTPEPWSADGSVIYLGKEGGFDLRDCPNPEANARRIVACVNACKGLEIDVLETFPGVVEPVLYFHEVRMERDALLQELTHIAMADIASWDDPTEFRAWAQNRARAAIARVKG